MRETDHWRTFQGGLWGDQPKRNAGWGFELGAHVRLEELLLRQTTVNELRGPQQRSVLREQ